MILLYWNNVIDKGIAIDKFILWWMLIHKKKICLETSTTESASLHQTIFENILLLKLWGLLSCFMNILVNTYTYDNHLCFSPFDVLENVSQQNSSFSYSYRICWKTSGSVIQRLISVINTAMQPVYAVLCLPVRITDLLQD